MLSTIADYTRLTTDMSKSLTQVAQQPDVSRDTAYYPGQYRQREDASTIS